MQLKISRITDVADLEYLAPIQFAAFGDDDVGHRAMLGVNNLSSINATIKRQKKEFTSDPSTFWIKVVDEDANNRIVGASEWKIYPTYVHSDFEAKDKRLDAMTAESLSFMEDEKRQEDGVIAVRGFMGARHRNAKEAHIVLNLLYVDQEYHRKGVGRRMVEYGNRLADIMMLPIWVEASKQGRGLYASCGFEVVEQVHVKSKHNTWGGDLSYPLMRRSITTSAL